MDNAHQAASFMDCQIMRNNGRVTYLHCPILPSCISPQW